MIFGAVHGEVVVQLEAPRRNLLHGFGLIDDIFEGGEVKLHPAMPHGGIGLYRPGHAVGMGADRPRGHRHPRAIFLAEEFIHRHASGLAHQIVHRRAQAQRGLVTDPIEGIRADVLVQNLLPLRPLAFAQTDQARVGVDHVNGTLRQVVVVDQFIGPGFVVGEGDPVDLDLGDFHSPIHRAKGESPVPIFAARRPGCARLGAISCARESPHRNRRSGSEHVAPSLHDPRFEPNRRRAVAW